MTEETKEEQTTWQRAVEQCNRNSSCNWVEIAYINGLNRIAFALCEVADALRSRK